MVAPIVIDLGVADPPRESVQVLIEACSQAAADTACHLVREAPEGPYAAVAIVTWEDGDRVRVEVGLRRPEGATWRSREITFQAADAELERYKSVGFVVGTLASAEGPGVASSQPEPARAEPAPEARVPPLNPAPATPIEREPIAQAPVPPRGWISVLAVGGRAVDRGAPRFGSNLRVGVNVWWRLAAIVSAGASTRARDDRGLLVSWMDAGLGLGVALGAPGKSRMELRAEGILEHLSAEARGQGGVETSASTRPGARFGVDGVLQLTDSVAIVGGLDALGRSTKTEFRVEALPAGSTTRFDVGAALGARLDL